MLSFEQIKELIDLVRERRLGVLELEHAGFRLKIEGTGRAAAPPDQPAAEPGSESAPQPAEAAAPVEPPAAREPEAREHHVLKSPIVGTFYSAPSPDSDPYVQVGAAVKKGQVLCIVEAMKLMNEIESDVDGEVLEIHPRNAQSVEFAEPLFTIRTA